MTFRRASLPTGRPSDGPAFRFLWRDLGSTKPPYVYQIDVHLFVAVSSPAVCSNALREAAIDAVEENILKQITRHFYVDNWLVSFPTTAEAISTAHQLTNTPKKGGFPLTQWATSNEIVHQSLPGKQLEGAVINLDSDAEPIERTLGLGRMGLHPRRLRVRSNGTVRRPYKTRTHESYI